MIDFDTNGRPDSYWPESPTPEQRMSHIKGVQSQAHAQRPYKDFGFAALDDVLVRESLP